MCETSSFFYYIIIRFCHPYGVLWWVGHPPGDTPPSIVCRPFGTPCSLLLPSVVSIVNGQQTDARTERPYKLLITHFARADTRAECPY